MLQLIAHIELKYDELQTAISETGSLSSAIDRIFFTLPTSIDKYEQHLRISFHGIFLRGKWGIKRVFAFRAQPNTQ